MGEKLLITAALPYANGPLHFGHIAGAYLPADAYARFAKLQGYEVCFVCGSDEYGVAITLSAEIAGRTPQEHIDIWSTEHRKLFNQMGIEFTHFSRTTWPGHSERVHQYFLDLLENGYIEPRITEQLYSEADNRFLADRYVVGTCPKCGYEEARGDECQRCGAAYEATDLKNPRSKLTNATLTLKSTEHWFLLLDKFREPLLDWISKKSWKANVLNFAKHYIEDVHPRAITRDAEWGVSVPLEGAKGKVIYVWFEAVIGYISATMDWAQKIGEPDRWRDFWLDPQTRLVQFLGKDNIPFHGVFFPAMTLGQNQPFKIVDDLVANEFLNLEGRQFSKSDNWFIDLDRFFSRYTSDQIRYTLAANAPETSDAEFTWTDFRLRCNSELLGKYGNLVNRTLVFAQRYCDGKIPDGSRMTGVEEKAFLAELDHLTAKVHEAYSHYSLRQATHYIMGIAAAGNSYFDAKQPWKAAKREGGDDEVAVTIAYCLEGLKRLAITSWPILPHAAEKIWAMLGFQTPLKEVIWEKAILEPLKPGISLPKPEVLFRKIEEEEIAEEEALLS